MIKMIKTIISALIYILIIAVIFVFCAWLVQDLVAYQISPEGKDIPLLIQIVRFILNIPILGGLIETTLSLLV